MNRKIGVFTFVLFVVFIWAIPAPTVFAAEPIVIGVPTSLGFLEGKESHKAVQLAVSEINANGGVNVGGTKRPFKVVAADLRDAAAGVPVPEALLGLEKLILEKKPTAIVVGPFRSEALLAGMDILSKYKMPMLGTIAMSPGTEAKIKKDPEKYKYVFRVSLNVIYWAKLLGGTMATLKKDFGFDKVYIMNQDVAWARGTANAMKNRFFLKTGWEVVGHDQYPTGFSDFSSALMKAKAKKAGMKTSEFMRLAAEDYEPGDNEKALVSMINEMNKATANASKSIDEALAFVAASNKRISKMEAEAKNQ